MMSLSVDPNRFIVNKKEEEEFARIDMSMAHGRSCDKWNIGCRRIFSVDYMG